jgi:4-hydroxybenzoate polyprenyltransferase
VAVVTFVAALAGSFLGTGEILLSAVGTALFIAGVPYYYVYALNALTDRVEDAVNHPDRPLPAGDISERAVRRFVFFLLAAAIGGSFFLFTGRSLFLALLIPFLGTLYSAPPLRLKVHPLIAVILTAWGMAHPFFITTTRELFPVGVSLCVFAAGVVLFKDIGDTRGDRAAGRRPLVDLLSPAMMGSCSAVLLVAAAAALFLTHDGWLFLLPLAPLAVLLRHIAKGSLASFAPVIYRRMIAGAVVSVLFVSALTLWGAHAKMV